MGIGEEVLIPQQQDLVLDEREGKRAQRLRSDSPRDVDPMHFDPEGTGQRRQGNAGH